eukprot:366450-Chlamydomonas_euryale.AAC.31
MQELGRTKSALASLRPPSGGPRRDLLPTPRETPRISDTRRRAVRRAGSRGRVKKERGTGRDPVHARSHASPATAVPATRGLGLKAKGSPTLAARHPRQPAPDPAEPAAAVVPFAPGTSRHPSLAAALSSRPSKARLEGLKLQRSQPPALHSHAAGTRREALHGNTGGPVDALVCMPHKQLATAQEGGEPSHSTALNRCSRSIRLH